METNKDYRMKIEKISEGENVIMNELTMNGSKHNTPATYHQDKEYDDNYFRISNYNNSQDITRSNSLKDNFRLGEDNTQMINEYKVSGSVHSHSIIPQISIKLNVEFSIYYTSDKVYANVYVNGKPLTANTKCHLSFINDIIIDCGYCLKYVGSSDKASIEIYNVNHDIINTIKTDMNFINLLKYSEVQELIEILYNITSVINDDARKTYIRSNAIIL